MAEDAGTRLMRAVACCDEEGALAAMAEGGGLGHRERETGYTALHYACQYGLPLLAAALLDAGAALQEQTKDLILQNAVVQPGGQTPLHLAARAGETEVVQLLISRRGDLSATDADDFTPAAVAKLRRHHELAQKLAEVSGDELQSEELLREMEARGVEAGKLRAQKQLEVPDHLRQVYSLERVWSLEECDRVLAAVKDAVAARADGWTTNRHAAYATTDVPCSEVSAVDSWVRQSLRERVFPKLAARHGWPPEDGSGLDFRDLFFVQYSAAPGGQAGLALHRDGSIISFNILLNKASDFEGGGTYIEADDRAYGIDQGDCFVHSGKLRHGGQPITRGERYVLVAFVDVLEPDERASAVE